MAEVVGLVASIVAVAELAGQVVRLCKGYIDAVQDAPRDLRVILVEVSTLKGLLESISLLQDTPLLIDQHELLTVQVEQLRASLAEIERLLGEQEVEETGRKRVKVTRSLSTLAWPIKKTRIMQRLEDVGKCKGTISLILLADSSKEIKEIRDDVRDIKDKLSENERQEILKKLIIVDPSSNHAQACSLHEPHTSSWITRSEEWKAWIHGDLRLLWIHGIPGAGKTILASFIIEQIRALSDESAFSEAPNGWAYYYCHHGRSVHTGESAPFLGWIVSQLSRQADFVPREIQKIFHSGNITVSSDLVSALSVLAKRFNKIYVVIDALDECQHRPSFLALLQQLQSSPIIQNLRLLVTSRDELDIRRVMTPISTSLSMANPLVEEDIRTYIQSHLKSDPKFTRWPMDLLHDVEDALTTGAKGMFRWAACQLEILRRLSTVSAIRQALVNLPETLDEVYERILCSIPKESRNFAFRTLSLLCTPDAFTFHKPNMLAEAIRWTDISQGKPEDELLDIDALYEFCVCLLTKETTNGHLILAHYTVKEFLFSRRILNGPARYFSSSPDNVINIYLTTILNRVMWPEEPYSMTTSQMLIACLMNLPTQLTSSGQHISENPDTYLKVCTLFHPSTAQLSRIAKWIKQGKVYGAGDKTLSNLALFDRIHINGGGSEELIARLSLLGAGAIVTRYVDRLDELQIRALGEAKVPYRIFGDCTILEIVSAAGLLDLVQLFLRKSVRLAPENKIMYFLSKQVDLALLTKRYAEFEETFNMALHADANPDPPGVPSTPLQQAVFHIVPNVVEWLLNAGADPNALGSGILSSQHSKEVDKTAFWENMKPIDMCSNLLSMWDALERRYRVHPKNVTIHQVQMIRKLLVDHGAIIPSVEGGGSGSLQAPGLSKYLQRVQEGKAIFPQHLW